MQTHLYIFSGLGADESIFQKIDFNFSAYHFTFVQWIVPEKNETIESYAKRLVKEQVYLEKPILIGLSFGGMIALEVAKQIDTKKVIIIASAKNKYEIPFYFRLIGKIRLHRLVPAWLLKKPNWFLYWLFGVTNRFDRQLLKQTLINTEPKFLKWAIDKIVRWQNRQVVQNVTHIHGTSDRILPLYFVNCDIKIENGGHLMILNKAEELMNILIKEIEMPSEMTT